MGDEHTVVSQQHHRVLAERLGDLRALLGLGDQVRAAVVDGEPAVEHDRVVGQVQQLGVGGRERGRVRRVPVDDRPDVVAAAVDLGVEHGLEVHLVGGVAQVGAELELDHVGGCDLGEGDAAALDPHPLGAIAITGADVSQGQVLIALVGQDPARPGDPLAKILAARGVAAVRGRATAGVATRPQRRSVGG